jgi:hypothetical protein
MRTSALRPSRPGESHPAGNAQQVSEGGDGHSGKRRQRKSRVDLALIGRRHTGHPGRREA